MDVRFRNSSFRHWQAWRARQRAFNEDQIQISNTLVGAMARATIHESSVRTELSIRQGVQARIAKATRST